MKVIKRWTTGLFSQVDWMISQVENQEALVNSALREAQKAAAQAKVQLGRVRQDGQRLRQRLQEENESATRWRERAAKYAQQDESKAMECLRRSKRSEKLASQLQQRLTEHEHMEKLLAKDVRKMEDQISELVEKRNLMRTRQSRAEAVTSIQGSTETMSGELSDVFERWETRVTEKELGAQCSMNIDPFEESFTSAEDEEQLREELRRLTGEQ